MEGLSQVIEVNVGVEARRLLGVENVVDLDGPHSPSEVDGMKEGLDGCGVRSRNEFQELDTPFARPGQRIDPSQVTHESRPVWPHNGPGRTKNGKLFFHRQCFAVTVLTGKDQQLRLWW